MSENVKAIFASNEPSVARSAASLLLQIVNNILEHPGEVKYQKIKVSNSKFVRNLLPAEGGVQTLFEIGFEEDGEHFTLSKTYVAATLRTIRQQLKAELDKDGTNKAAEPPQSVQRFSAESQARTQGMYAKLHSSFEHVLVYENTGLQQKARALIPDTLQESARKAHEESKKSTGSDDEKAPNEKDFYLLELLNWFKNTFFKWVNNAPCHICSGDTESKGMVPPNPQEELHWTGRVEQYWCPRCSVSTRFPRYNHPGRLLDTRCGRCGEWANCFTLIARACGFEARYVLDWTDHVWTEVYSEAQQRWLHCDPCENVCDKPLLYEAGWGKQLTYVIAFSKDDVQDVTWRYTRDHAAVRARRTECSEQWLLGVTSRLRQRRQTGLSADRQRALQQRELAELCELMSDRQASAEELVGRSTGSLAWRRARGELGPSGSQAHSVIKPVAEELSSKVVHMKYSCAKDVYIRLSANDMRSNGWDSMTSQSSDIIRKEEQDWKMVYLARREGSKHASVTWEFDLSGHDVSILAICIFVDSRCYENGRVTWRLCSDNECALILPGQKFETTDFRGCKSVKLTADLDGGKCFGGYPKTECRYVSL